jgi:pyruvate dehydrogenase E2 component (dihydrolipoamide acetyltransferase)
MPSEITMPKLSDTMEEGTILRWFKHEGDRVEPGEVLAEVETDKADMELEADKSGIVREIRVKEGEAAAVGAVLVVLADGDAGQPSAAAPKVEAKTKSEAETPAAPRAVPPPPPAKPAARPTAAKAQPPPTPPPSSRVVTPPSSAAPAPPATKWTPRPGRETPAAIGGRQEVSKLRQAVAKQMTASKREVPHFYVTSETDMSEAARLRTSLKGVVPERITFTHLLIRALALTLPRHARVNASWSDGAIVYHDDVNIGIAVAVEDGLIAPVLRGCQQLSLREIARAAAELIEKAQAGRFGGDALTGGTFTISNMGMLDIEEFSAVIIPPQAAILAVGAIKDRAVVRNGQLAVAKTMRLTLSADHRVLNGIEAGRFMEDLKHVLENPVVLVMERE